MPTMFSTETVTVLRPGDASVDAHGNEVPGEWIAEEVCGVLPQPGSTADLGAERPDGVTVAMTFHFPKGYAASLKGCRVSFGGRDYPVIGDPQPFPSANCPTPWAMAVECEACDG